MNLVVLLSKRGFGQASPGGHQLLYRSRLRTIPLFSINDALDVWYDHGTGGNVIDFGMTLML